MPRPNPEQLFATVPWSYVQTNKNNSKDDYQQARIFYRTYVSSNTAGYPRFKLLQNHTVLKRRVFSPGSLLTYRHWPSLGGIANYEVTARGAVYEGFIFNRDVSPYNSNVTSPPSGCPYTVYDCQHDKTSLTRALDAAMDDVHDQSINLAQALAERAQTSRLIYESANKIYRAIYAAKRGRVQEVIRELGYHPSYPKKLTGEMSKDWLALQYGWKPLLSDVYGACELLAKKGVSGNPLELKVKKTRTFSSPQYTGERTHVFDSSSLGPFKYSFSPIETTSKVMLRFAVTNQFYRDGKSLGITDPLTLAWELLPWSFVIDWFIPVGDFLRRLNYDSGLQYVDGYTVQLSTQWWQYGCISNSYKVNNGYPSVSNSGTDASGMNLRLDRNILVTPPRPMWPRFKDPFSPVHALNAIALLRGVAKVK